MALTLLGRRLLTRCRTHYIPARNGYIVLIPEYPGEFSEETPSDILPDFSNMTTEKCLGSVTKYLLDFETGIWKMGEEIEKNPPADIFKDVLNPLEDLGNTLDTHWAISKVLYLTNSNLMPAKSYLNIHGRARRARSAKFNNQPIYKLCKSCDKSLLDEEEKRVLDKFLLEGKLNGLELDEYKKIQLNEALHKLGDQRTKFRGKVEIASSRFKHIIKDATLVRQFPSALLQSMSQNQLPGSSTSSSTSAPGQIVKQASSKELTGPWVVTLQPQIQNSFLENCSNGELRWNMWQAKAALCGGYDDRQFETSTHLEEIRFYRREQAQLLGYETYADMSMETKMAGSVDVVRDTIDLLLDDAFGAQVYELESLRGFASQRGHSGSLAPWDIPYWSRQLRIHELDGMAEDDLREYFPLPQVFTSLVNLCNRLFGFTIKEEPEVVGWHSDVRFFTVTECNESNPIAGFYFDPYNRPSKPLTGTSGSMVGLRNRHPPSGIRALAVLIFHWNRPQDDQPTLLTFQDVRDLFAKFGIALQHMLSKTKYTEVAGLTNVEWDALGICSHFMTNWLSEELTLSEMAVHYKTGQPLPAEVLSKLCAWDRHLAGHSLCRELYLSTLDLDIYSMKDFWLDIVRRLWPSFHSYELYSKDSHPCSFSAIFSDEWAAAYYSQFWSRMIAADIYSAFLEAGPSDPRAIADLGYRFKNTFLSAGGGLHPSTLFRHFRGRDPSPTALLDNLGLTQTSLEA